MNSPSTGNPVRLALVGAGLFARDAHVPAINALRDAFEVVAVCSRTRASAEATANLLDGQPDIMTDIPALLERDDVEAVNLILPIGMMPEVVEMALKAGKHVISEKPAAPDVAVGRRLLEAYAQYPEQVWMVAENVRYEATPVQAAEIINSGEIGKPLTCQWIYHIPMTEENQYYHTAWRRDESFPGGYVLDAGVHHIATFRMLLGEITNVSAVKAQHRPDLPPLDTLSVNMRFENGAVGVYFVTYATRSPWESVQGIVGDKGALQVKWRESLEVTTNGETRSVPIRESNGIEGELAAFAAAIRKGEPHRNRPEQGIQDVAVMEAMLRSAEKGESVEVERVV